RVGDLFRDAAGLLFGDLVPAWKHAAYQSRPGRRRFASTTQSYVYMLQEINPHAGAVDVGSEHFHAAVYGGPMEIFGTFTRDLERVKVFFQKQGVQTVAMEATGVYWMPLYEVLEKGGLKVCLVNGAHVQNVPGRKTDIADCQWLAELHAHGLLEAG